MSALNVARYSKRNKGGIKMIIKMIFDKTVNYLEKHYGLNIFHQSGLRLAYVMYQAVLTSDQPIKITGELLRKAHELIKDNSSYTAFERSVYREIKELFPNENYTNILPIIYRVAKGIQL